MSNKNRLLDMLNSATSPPNAMQPTTTLTPPSGTPREPSPLPPSSALQAVSLSDLFAGLTSPSAPQPGRQGDLSVSLNGMQAKTSTTATPSIGREATDSPSSDPTTRPDHKANLLNMFKSSPVQPAVPNPASSATTAIHSPDVQSAEVPTQGAPHKSMFDFVSPFDVFEKPKPKPKSSEAHARSSEISTPAKTSTPPAPEVRQRQASAANPQQARDLHLPHLSSNLFKGVTGSGPKSTTTNITVDLSDDNADSLINHPGVVQITPTTILKNPVGFQKGRTVGVTPGWLAYALSKGRIRLISSASGARLVLQIPSSPVGDIIDVAVISESVAVVGPDRSVTVFEVPESWEVDDPPCKVVAHLSPDDGFKANRVEFLRKQGTTHLVIGSDAGVIVVPRSPGNVPMAQLLSRHKLLKSEGPLADFCLNHSHQAIGLLSVGGQFTLYNVSNLNRVWNRPLPSSKSASPSSVRFVEANILVGRDNNTHFDLVQITVDITVLSTIVFTSPSPVHFAQAVYDSARGILWIAPFARGSLYAVRYALKGVPPGRGLAAFDKIAEYPLEPVLSLALNPKSEDAELFFATPNGFSLVQIEKLSCDEFGAPPVETGAAPEPTEPSRKQTNERQKSHTKGEATVKAEPAEERAPSPAKVVSAVEPMPESSRASPAAPTTSYTGEMSDLLKKTEDSIASNVKADLASQFSGVLSRMDALATNAAVEKALKVRVDAAMAQAKTEFLPIVESLVRTEMNAVSSSVQSAVSAAMTTTSETIEKSLAKTHLAVANAVHHSVEKTLQDALQGALLPVIQAATGNAAERLSAEFRSEMLQMRKDLASHGDIGTLATSIADLQKQVAALTEQLSRQAASPNPPQPHTPMPPAQPPMPPAHVLEDVFLSALGDQTTSATVSLVNDHWSMTQGLLPLPPGKSPLSPAIILTLLHRLALALIDINPADPAFLRVVDWEKRVAVNIDPRSPDIAAFYGRVVPIVQATLGNILQSLRGQSDGPIRQILEILAAKS